MHTQTRPGPRLLQIAVVLAGIAFMAFPALAQPRSPQRPIAVKNATIWTLTGEPIDGGTVLVVGRKIRAVGKDVQVPPFAQVIDGTGLTVIPGLIDADSSLGLAPEPNLDRRARPTTLVTSRSADAIDLYETDAVEEALRNGVTTIFVAPHGDMGIYGLGAVIKLRPGTPLAERIVVEEAALCGAVGSGRNALPILRLRETKQIRDLLKGAKEYQKSWEEYDESFEEYKEKILERQKKKEKDKEKDKDKGKNGEKGPEEKKPDRPKVEPPKEEPPKEEPPKEEPPKPEPPKDGGVFHLEDPETLPLAEEEPPKAEAPADTEKKKNGKEELKKPAEPQVDRAKALLVKALEGKIAVRIEAHRAEDILNALEIAREFPMRLVLEGATEAALVRDAIAEAEVPVILRGTIRPAVAEEGIYRNHDPETPALLHGAGIPLAIASGAGDSDATRLLWAAAGLAAASGLDLQDALAAVTRDAAKILGVDDRLGTIEEGKDADLVILSGSPFAGDTVVEAVLVDGKIVYSKEDR